MIQKQTKQRAGQRGYTLVEVLVASAIFTIIFIAALLIYDRSNKVFKQSVESSDMQQSTRVAFDQLVSDVRMTGFDFDRDGRPFGLLGIKPWEPDTTYVTGNVVQPTPPNGHAYVVISPGKSGASPPTWPTGSKDTVTEASGLEWEEKGVLQYQQPDEQLEFMGATAITIRGNLDYETDAANDNGREDGGSGGPNLESVYFPVVTTANDEIVTYALKSHDSSKNTDSIVFFADTYTPRQVHPEAGKAEKEVKITNVDLSNANPPYTLYRYTLKQDGTPDAGTPLADNIRSLNFRYFRDTAGTMEVAPNGGAGQYDGANPAETVERQARREIRAIRVDLVGMNPQPDFAYTDPDDTVAPNHRQYRLESMIVPRNLGRRGMKELSTEEPGKPTIKAVCMGNCNVAYVTWEPPLKGDVITYNVMYDVDDTGGYMLEDVGNTIEAWVGKYLVPNQEFFFRVQAINPYGFSTSDNSIKMTTVNKTKPLAPASAVATGGTDATYPAEENQIRLAWPRVTENDDAAKMLVCSDGAAKEQKAIPPNERVNYRLLRGTTENFAAGEGVVALNENSTVQPAPAGTEVVFADTTAANCKDYWYRFQAVDACVAQDNYNDPAVKATATSAIFPPWGQPAILGRASTTVPPAKPMALSVVTETCQEVSLNCTVKVEWTAVTRNTATPAAPITIDTYQLSAEKLDPDTNQWVVQSTTQIEGGLLSYTFQDQFKTESYRYRVRAIYPECGPLYGVWSDYLYYPCDFPSTITGPVVSPIYGGAGTAESPYLINGPTSVTISLNPGAAEKFELWSSTGTEAEPQSGTSATFGIPDPPDDQPTQIFINVTLPSGCQKLVTFWVLDQAPPACPAGAIGGTAMVSLGRVDLSLTNLSSQQTLTLKRIKVRWNRDLTTSPMQADLEFVKVNGFNALQLTQSLAAPFWTEIWEAPLASTIPPGATNYPVQFFFDLAGKKTLNQNPIANICIEYASGQQDALVCGFTVTGLTAVPSGCTIP